MLAASQALTLSIAIGWNANGAIAWSTGIAVASYLWDSQLYDRGA
jgi:hypothetical protein